MKLIHLLKEAITMNDFFYSAQLLRFKQQSQYRTLTGGILSIGIIIMIIIAFASMILSMLERTTITTSSSIQKKPDPPLITFDTSLQKNQMFGVEITGIDLNANKRYFDVKGILRKSVNGQEELSSFPLVPCTRQHWKQFSHFYDEMYMSYWLCPQIGEAIDLYGRYTQNSQVAMINIYPCDNATDPSRPCATQTEIDTLFVNNLDNFYLGFYFINKVVNPNKVDYVQYYLDDKNFAIFGPNIANLAILHLADYTIQSDVSILPFENYNEEKGFYARQLAVNYPLQYQDGSFYMSFSIMKSNDSYYYKRTVLKISEVFSYIGGIIGAVFALLFFLKNFTDFSLEAIIASTVFRKSKDQPETPQSSNQSQNSQKQDSQKISGSFWKFLKFGIYSFCRFIGKQLQWKDMKVLDEYRKQIIKQLDIQSIIKRLIFLEHSITYLLEDFQLEGLQLQRPVTPQEIKKLRQRCHFSQELQSQSSESSDASQEAKGEMKAQKYTVNIKQNQNSVNQLNYKVNFKEPESSPTSFIQTYKLPTSSKRQDDKIIIRSISDCNQSQMQVIKAKRPSIDFNIMENIFPPQKSKSRKLTRKAQKQQTFLKNLKVSKQQGNLVSKKIWDALQQRTQKSIKKMMPPQFLGC